jgi:hypothetical protein
VVGHPATIALKYPTGKQVTSRIHGAPDQMFYTLADGAHAYFPLEVGARIDELRLQPGEPFTVLHLGGPRWDVRREQTGARQHSEDMRRAPAPYAATQTGTPAAVKDDPNARRSNLPQVTPGTRVNGQGEDSAAILARSYEQAIEIQAAAYARAWAKGLPVAIPTMEALQACAATLFITETRGQR